MRATFYSAILFCLLILPMSSIAQWAPKATGSTFPINCISHGSSSAIFAAGFDEFFRSTNGGATWQKKPFIDNFGNQVFSSNFTDIHFFNANEGVVVGNIGGFSEYILRTTNGGESWTEVHSNNMGIQPPVLNEVDFPTPNVGYAVGRNGRVLKTTNSGETWSAQPGILVFSEIYSVDFINEQVGCITTSANTVQRTTDGGLTWNVVHVAQDVHSISFAPDGSVGYVCGGNTILQSLDQGATWVELPNPIGLTWVVKAVSMDTVYISTFSNGLNISTTGGQYWETFPTIPLNQTVYGLSFLDPQNGCIVGVEGSLRCTDNAGGPAKPVPVFSTDETLFCEDSVVHFTNHSNPALSFTWQYNGTTIGTGLDLDFAFPQGGTSAEISLTANNGSLSGTATQSFNIEPSLGIEPFSLSLAQSTICPGDVHTVLANNLEFGVQYQLWQGGVPVDFPLLYLGSPLSFASLPMHATAPLTLRGTKTGTCGTGILEQAITAPVVAPPSLGLAVSSPDDAICEYGSTTIQLQGSQPGVTYQLLLDGVPTGNAVAGTGGNLYLPTGQLFDTLTITVRTVQLSSGCANTLSGSVWMPVEKRPTTFFTLNTYNQTVGDPIFTLNNSINPGGTYEWTFEGAANTPTSTEAAPTGIFWNQPGTYNVTLLNRSPLGCGGSYLRTIHILPTIAQDSCMGSFIRDAGGALYGLEVDNEGNRIAFIHGGYSTSMTIGSPAGDLLTISGTNPNTEGPYYLAKFDSRGIAQWATKIIYYSSFGKLGAVETDDDNNIFVTFYHGGSAPYDSVIFHSTNGRMTNTNPVQEGVFQYGAYVAKYDKHGILQWYKSFVDDYTVWQMQLVCDEFGNVYVGSRFFLRKFSPTGELLWGKYIPNPQAPNDDVIADLELDAEGNILVGMSLLGFQRVSPDGDVLASAQPVPVPPQGQPYYLEAASFELDETGNIYLMGHFYETLPFADSTLYDPGFQSGAGDGFVAKMTSAGEPLWIRQIRSSAAHKLSGFDLSGGEISCFGVVFQEARIAAGNLPSLQFSIGGHYALRFDTAGNLLQFKKLHEDQQQAFCNVTPPFEDLQYSPINGLPVIAFEHRTGFEFDGENVPPSPPSSLCEFYIANASLDCFNASDIVGVWPGDCNDDGTANHLDLLQIGLAMGQAPIGTARFDQGTDWTQKGAIAWDASISGVNAAHADANGNGMVSSADVQAITANYGQVHGFAPQPTTDERADGIILSIGEAPGYAIAGEVLTLPILVTMPDSTDFPLYGVAFQVEGGFGDFYVNDLQIDLTDSWLSADGNAISLVQPVQFEPKRDVSVVRTDGQNAIGSGQIGTLSFRVDYNNTEDVDITLTGNLAVDAAGNELPFQTLSLSFPAGPDTSTAVNLRPQPQPAMKLYPVPTIGNVTIELTSDQWADWHLTDLLGKAIQHGRLKGSTKIDLKGLPSGPYFIQTVMEDGTWARGKIVVE